MNQVNARRMCGLAGEIKGMKRCSAVSCEGDHYRQCELTTKMTMMIKREDHKTGYTSSS